MKYLIQTFYYLLLQTVLAQLMIDTYNQVDIKGIEFDWSARTLPIGDQQLLIAQNIRGFDQLFQVELMIIDIMKNEVFRQITIGGVDESTYCPDILIIDDSIFIAYVSEKESSLYVVMKKYSLSLQESNVKFNVGNTLYEVKTIQKIQYIQLTQLNENLLSIQWYSLGREYNTKQWNMVLYNPTTGVKGEKIILPDSDFISVTQNKLGVIAIAQSNNNKLILSRLYEGQLITRSIPAVSYSQQRVKINSLSTNEFIVIKWTTQYNFEIRRFNKYFEASHNPFRIQTKEFCSVEKIQQIDISFTESKLIFVSKCDEEIKLQQIDLLNIQNNQYISEQYRQIKTQNKQNIQSIQINYIDHNRLLLRWFTQKHYFNELKVQLIDMNLKINECILNCDICDNRFKCQQCQQNYQLDTIKNQCKPICPINCLYCSDSTYCDKCKLGYQYTKENLCVNPNNDFMELKVSREVETKGKGKLINKDFYIIIIYSIYQNDKQQYLVIRKLDNQGQLLKKVELQKDQQTLLDYDIADSLVDEIFYILIKWVSFDGSTTIINYSYNLEDLTIKEEYLITDQSTIIVGDQIKIINYKQQKIYFFYFTKENDYYTLKQIIMNQNDVYTNSNYYHLSYKDNFELKSYRNSIGNEYMTILNDDQYQQCQIMDTSLNCYQDTNQDRTEFFSQKIIKIDQISLYLDQDIYLNRQLYLNNTDNYKIQITQSSRYQQNHTFIQIGENDIIILWSGISNIQQNNPISNIYIQGFSKKTNQITNLKSFTCSPACFQCSETGVCLQCKNYHYILDKGKCKLQCIQNCEYCQVENECLKCKLNYFLDSQSKCVQTEKDYILQKQNYLYPTVFQNDDGTVSIVSIKNNGTKYDIVYEEFDRQGQSISGENRISNDSNLTVLFKQPKLIKQDQFIIISYLVRDDINNLQIKAIFVTLDNQYQIIQNNVSFILNQDMLFEILQIDNQLHIVYTYDYYSYAIYLSISQYSIKNGLMNKLNERTFGDVFTLTKKYYNLKLENTFNQNKFSIQFTEVDVIDQIVYIYDYVELKLTKSTFTTYQLNYINFLQIFTVQYNIINNKKINLQFFNQRVKLLNTLSLESIYEYSKIQVLTTQFFIYLLYAESSQQNIININVKQYDLNGILIAENQISSNEQSIDYLNGNSQQNEFLYITWSSIQNRKSYKMRLNQKLQAIPFDNSICVSQCGDCSSNDKIMCNQCLDGYYYNEQKLICSPICSDNCQNCTSPYTCDYCNNNFKYVDNKCLNVTDYQLEISICQQTCNGIGSILTFNDNTMITTFYNYKNQQHSLDLNIYQLESSVITTKQLISSETAIPYHRIYEYESKKFALIWLSGNCKVSCRMMIQLFQSSLVVITNPVELRMIKVLNIDEFEIQIKIFSSNFIIVWTEIDDNLIQQTYVGIYNINTGFSIKQNINENQDDISINPQLLIQTSSYQIIYIKNNNIINSLTIDSTTAKYKQLYQSTNQIDSISSDNIDSSGLAIGWIEIEINQLGMQNYYLNVQWFDRQLNQQAVKRTALNSYIKIKSLRLDYISSSLQSTFIQIEKGEQQRIRQYFINLYLLKYGSTQDMLTIPLNILSQYQANTNILTYVDPRNLMSYVVFQGTMNNVNQIFFIEKKGQQSYQDNCETNCFYCNNQNVCVICKQGYSLYNNKCSLKLPDNCSTGSNGRCSQCAIGYSITSDYKCQLSDSKYKEIKMSNYPAQSRQRLSTLSNGDYIVVWSTQFYQNEGTGIYMSLYNSQGVQLKDQMRITESSAGIQQYPDVQVMNNDEIVVVWIDGNILVNADIKMCRFNRDFIRIGSEITVQTNIHLQYVQSFDTPVIIQQLINGFAIVWSEQGNQQSIQLMTKFFDNNSNELNQQIVTENESIINEPVVASTQSIIVIAWQTNKGIFANSYSLNQILIDRVQLSNTGEAPTITSVDNYIIIAWKEYVIDENDFMSQKIRFRKISGDLNQYEIQSHFGISQENLDNPDVIQIENGFAIIAESVSTLNDKVRAIQLQLFNLDGSTKSQPIIVYSISNLYPHHPQLINQPQGNFIASWIQSTLVTQILSDDVYMKRFKSDGTQLSLNTIICPDNCLTCSTSDVCQSCKKNYIILSNQCYPKIDNCETHVIENSILSCSQCINGFNLIKNSCYWAYFSTNYQTIEFIIDKSYFDIFKVITFSNGDLLYFWMGEDNIMTQRFDKQGKRYSNPKELKLSTTCTSCQYYFDVCLFKLKEEIFVFSFKIFQYNYSSSTTYINIFNFNEELLSSNSIFSYQGEINSIINQKYQKQLTKILLLENMKLGLIHMVMQQEIPILELVIIQLYVDSSFKINFSNQQTQAIQLLTYSQFKNSLDLDIQIIDNEIKIYQKNELSNTCIETSFDFFGVQLNKHVIKKQNNMVEYKMIKLNSDSYLIVWTAIVSFKYEIFFQIQQQDGIELRHVQQIFSGNEIYKLDLQINQLSNSILITWREGSQFQDMTLNSVYKGVFISKDTYVLTNIASPINQENSYTKSLGKVEVLELPNRDIIINILFYNILSQTQIIKSYKINATGSQVDFIQMRCGYACQECNYKGFCFKCTNPDLFILQVDGNCVKKPQNCVNFKSNCLDCIDGYYKTQYLTCEKINQQIEKSVPLDYQSYYLFYYQVATYQNGNFVVVGFKESNVIELNYFLSDGTAQIQKQQIINHININKINDISITIDDKDQLTIFYSVLPLVFTENNMYYYQQFDKNFNNLTEPILFYSGLQQYETTTIKAKILIGGQFAILIKSRFDIYVYIMKSNFEFVGDIKQPFSENFDIISNGELIAFAYIKDTITIINFFDLKLKVIQHQIVNDGGLIKLASNAFKQFIIVTNYQINIIDQGTIISSYNTTLQSLYPIQIAISDINEIVILSYQKNSKSYHLLYFSMQGLLKNFVQVNMNQYTEIPIQNSWLLKLQNSNFLVFFHIGSLNYNSKLNFARFDQLGISRSVNEIICPQNCISCVSSSECDICSFGFEKNDETKLCEKFCMQFECRKCMLTDCDECSNGFQLNEFGHCQIIDQSIEHTKDPYNPSYQEEVIDPNIPGVPTDPVDPIDIQDPADPTNPTDPTDPINPTDPTDPTNPTDPTDPTNPTDPTDPTNPTDPTTPKNPINIGIIEHPIGDKCNVIMQNKLINFTDNRYAFIQICNEIMSAKLFNKDGVEIQSFVFLIEIVIFFDTVLVQDQMFLAFVFARNPTSTQIFSIDNSFQTLVFKFETIQELTILDIQIQPLNHNIAMLISNNKMVQLDDLFLVCYSQTLQIFDNYLGLMTNKINFNFPNGIITKDNCNQNKISEIKVVEHRVYALSINLQGGQLQIFDHIVTKLDTFQIDIPNIEKIKFEVTLGNIIIIYKTIDAQNWTLKIYDKYLISFIVKVDFIPGNSDIQLAIVANNLFIQWNQNDNLMKSFYEFLDLQGNQLSKGEIFSDFQLNSIQLSVLMDTYVAFTWKKINANSQWEITYALMNHNGDFVNFLEQTCSKNCNYCISYEQCMTCETNYVLKYIDSNNNYCQKECDQNCQTCDQMGNCQFCKNFYEIKNGQCVLNELQAKAIRINQEAQNNLIQQQGAKFSDGSIIVVWSSNYYDGDDFEVYGQLINNFGVKIGDNLKINTNTQGPQHSPKVLVLQDDTALIIYIDGDPKISQATIKAQKFDKQMQRIGNEFQVGTIESYLNEPSNPNYFQAQSLKNGGFFIGYIQRSFQTQDLIFLNFYDSLSNLVIQQSIQGDLFLFEKSIDFVTTDVNIALFYASNIYGCMVHLYSLDGKQKLLTKSLENFNNHYRENIIIGHTHNFYAIGYILFEESNRIVQVQLFDEQFNELGNPITIRQVEHYIPQIQMNKGDQGLYFIIQLNINQQQFQELYLIKDQQYSLLNTFYLDIQQRQMQSKQEYLQIIQSQDQQYFILWSRRFHFGIQDIYDFYFQLLSYDSQIIAQSQITCPLNCQQCQEPTICDLCLDHYQKKEDICIPICEVGCSLCAFPYFCNLCQEGYYLKSEGKCYEIPIQQQPLVLYEYERGDRIVQVQAVNEIDRVFFSYSSHLNVKVFIGEQLVNSFSITEQPIDDMYRQKQTFYFDENIILIFYFENDVQVQRYDINSNLISQERLDLLQFTDFQIQYDALLLEPIQGQQYILTFYKQKHNPNQIYNLFETVIYYVKLDLRLYKIENVQIIFKSVDSVPFNIQKDQDSFYIYFYDQNYRIRKDKIEQLFCYNQREYTISQCNIPSEENWNIIQLFNVGRQNELFDIFSHISTQYKILGVQGEIIMQSTNVLNQGLKRQIFVKVFKYIHSFVIIIEEQTDLQYNEYKQLVAQFIYNTGKKIGDQIYICSLPQNFINIVQYQNGFKIYIQQEECQDDICKNNLIQRIFDRENDLPDPTESQILINDPVKDGKGIEIQEKCDQEPIKQLIKYSNNNYGIVYICQDIFRMRKFNQDGIEIKFVEITLELIHLFDITLVDDQIYVILVYVSDKTISKIYKLDDNTNSLLFQFDHVCELEILDIKIENLQMKYLIFITCLKNYVFDSGSKIGRSQSLFVYDRQNLKIFEKLDFNNPAIFTIDDCDKYIIQEIKVLYDQIYLVKVNIEYYEIIQINDFGVLLYTNTDYTSNISRIKLEISNELVVFMYKKYGQIDWFLTLCTEIRNCWYHGQNYLKGVQDFSIAIIQNKFVISYSEKLNQKLYYKVVDNNKKVIFSDSISIDQQISSPVLVNFNSQYIGFTWQFKNNLGQSGLQLSIINNAGNLVKYITNVCSVNCDQCKSDTQCIKCLDGYQLFYDKDGQISCQKEYSSFCQQIINGYCISCPPQLYPQERNCVQDHFQQYSLVVNELMTFTQTQPFLAGFSDGSIMIIWSSNYQNGFNWGVYGQILDSQRQKIGNNFQVTQIAQGNQHSAYIQILNDDTAIILYIDGNPEEGALLKIARLTKDQQRIGNDLDVDIIKLNWFNINYDSIAKIIKLQNGGYVVGYITTLGEQLQVLKLKFYNSDHQEVKAQEIQNYFDTSIQLSQTGYNVAIIFQNIVYIYTLDGIYLTSKEFISSDRLPMNYLGSFSQYYVIISYSSEIDILSVNAQFYDQNFLPYGNQILIKEILVNQDSGFTYIQFIQIDQYNGGLSLIIEFKKDNMYSFQEQYYINSNMEVKIMNKYYIQSFWQINMKNYVKIAQSIDQSFFVVWVSQNFQNKVDNSNIHVQKMTAQGEYPNQLAKQCSYGCITCDSQNVCTQCLSELILVDGYCSIICQQNCMICILPSVCSMCKDGYYEDQQGICNPLKSDYHQSQSLISQEIEGDVLQLIRTSDGTICFFSQYHSMDIMKYWNIYIIKDQQIIQKVQIDKTDSNINNQPIYINKIEQDYVIVYFNLQQMGILRIGENQQIMIDKLINLSIIFQDQYIYSNQITLEPLIGNQYSLTYYKNSYDKLSQTTIYNIILDSELNQIGQPQLLHQFDDVSYSFNQFNAQNGTAILVGDQLIWIKCPQSLQIKEFHCQVFNLQNSNQIQIFDSQNYFYDPVLKGVKSIYYRVLNSDSIPITQEVKVIEDKLQQQEFVQSITFQNTFAIILKQYNNYDISYQLIIQYFQNSGAKLGQQIYVNYYYEGMFKKIIQTENSLLIYWQKRICSDLQCSNIINKIQYKEYDDQGNEITKVDNINCNQNCDECINQSYCTKCSTNYFLDTNSQCKLLCPQNCIYCSIVQQCEICQYGYELVNNQCIKLICPNNCDLCTRMIQGEIICDKCQSNYQLNQQQCLPLCPSTCRTCDLPYVCSSCPQGFILTSNAKCIFEDPTIIDQAKNTIVSTPLRYTFPDQTYVLVWYQNGEQAGVYFQLYSVDNAKIGTEILVSDITRRLLVVDTQIEKQYYAHLAAVDYNFYIVWADSTTNETNFLLQEFNSDGSEMSSPQSIGISNSNVLSLISKPCELLALSNQNIFVSFMTQNSENQENYNFKYQIFDPNLQSINSVQEIPNVSYMITPSIMQDDSGMIYISYTSDGYVFVQQITQFGNPINQPQAISDNGTFTIKTAYLKNGMFVFLWENKNIQTFKAMFSLNYQLISKDLSSRSEVKGIGIAQVQEQTPDLKLFNDGFIVVWKTTNSLYQSIGIQFQIFDSLGVQQSEIIDVSISGKYPYNPNIQIINDDQFAITYISKGVDVDGSNLGDGIQIKYYNKQGEEYFIISPQLCGKECNICQSPLNCYRCSYGYYLSQDNQCIIDCGLYCNQCEVPLVCQSCVNGYSLNQNNSCTQVECSEGYQRNPKTKLCDPECPNECICTLPKTCNSCIAGYYLKNSQCYLKSNNLGENPISNPSIFYALIVVSILLLISWICCYKCIIQHRQKDKVHFVSSESNLAQENNERQISSAAEREQRLEDDQIKQNTMGDNLMIKQQSSNNNVFQIPIKNERDDDRQIKFKQIQSEEVIIKKSYQSIFNKEDE